MDVFSHSDIEYAPAVWCHKNFVIFSNTSNLSNLPIQKALGQASYPRENFFQSSYSSENNQDQNQANVIIFACFQPAFVV